MDGLILLQEAHAAGLKVKAGGGHLHIRGPRRAEPIVNRLMANKAEVLDALKALTEQANDDAETCRIIERDLGLPAGSLTLFPPLTDCKGCCFCRERMP
jgi:hypothetical protein